MDLMLQISLKRTISANLNEIINFKEYSNSNNKNKTRKHLNSLVYNARTEKLITDEKCFVL